jgi:hypothetical protein
MAEQDANSVAITGGTINNTTIGATTATTGKFTSVTTPSVTASSTNLNLYPASTGNIYLNQSLKEFKKGIIEVLWNYLVSKKC